MSVTHDVGRHRRIGRRAISSLGEAAEENYEALLEEGEYDAELGMAMAKDAMRLTKGELTEEEFYDRYHEDVLEEFGEDSRPMAERVESAREEGRLEDALDRLGLGERSRRETMKMGAGAGFLGLGAWGAASDDDPESPVVAQDEDEDEDADGDGVQWGWHSTSRRVTAVSPVSSPVTRSTTGTRGKLDVHPRIRRRHCRVTRARGGGVGSRFQLPHSTLPALHRRTLREGLSDDRPPREKRVVWC